MVFSVDIARLTEEDIDHLKKCVGTLRRLRFEQAKLDEATQEIARSTVRLIYKLYGKPFDDAEMIFPFRKVQITAINHVEDDASRLFQLLDDIRPERPGWQNNFQTAAQSLSYALIFIAVGLGKVSIPAKSERSSP